MSIDSRDRRPALVNITGLARLTDTQRAEQRLRIAHEILLVMLITTEHETNDGSVFGHSDEYVTERVNEALRFADALIERVT